MNDRTTLPELPPLDTTSHFAPLHAELITLLRMLAPDDWQRPTVAGRWRVRDVAAHLMDGDLRTLAAHRDGHQPSSDASPASYADVVQLIQTLNAGGVAFGARLSPRLRIDLLEVTGGWMRDFVVTLDPEAPALFPVAWAGESQSTNRFNTAREYTERWHHQMQIRDALADRGEPTRLLATPLFEPLLATTLRVLPHAYRAMPAPDGTTVTLAFEGAVAHARTLRRDDGAWRLYPGEATGPTARVRVTADAWWRLVFNALPRDAVPGRFACDGPEALLEPLWHARAVMV